jgi:hypothetical protein
VVLVLALPLAGAGFAGRITEDLFRFPPRLDILSGYLRFSWAAAAAVLLVLAATFLPWVRCIRNRPATVEPKPAVLREKRLAGPFPLWGWAAMAWTLTWWALAWTRWPWFSALQPYTFFPLWVGLVLLFNALAQHRTGSCLMLRAPKRWIALFGASAACWWVFEWLNRFVRNWHYVNVEQFGPLSYALHATACFATVLPAMAAVAEWLDSHPAWRTRLSAGPRWAWLAAPGAAWLLGALGVLGLFGAGAWREVFYPALWVSPLALWLALPPAHGEERLTLELARGAWQRAGTWMLASLICGFFWELWNWHSLAKWIYTVPGVERWHLFEMPALGYAGYLPFGLECLLVTEWLIGRAWGAQPSRSASNPASDPGSIAPACQH